MMAIFTKYIQNLIQKRISHEKNYAYYGKNVVYRDKIILQPKLSKSSSCPNNRVNENDDSNFLIFKKDDELKKKE